MKAYLKHEIPIETHNLFSVYFTEIGFLTFHIKKNCELIFEMTPLPEKGLMSLMSTSEPHILIYNILLYTTKIKRSLVAPKNKSRNETENQFKIKCRRIKILSETFIDVKITEMFDNKLRNSLEHFEEYLDGEIFQLMTDTNYHPSNGAGHNIVLSHWEVFTPKIYPIRLYIASEKKYYNFKYSIDIAKIHDEACALWKKIVELNLIPISKEGEISNSRIIAI